MIGEPKVILLVEDNPDHIELVRRSLAMTGVANQLLTVPDGQAALDMLIHQGPCYGTRQDPVPDLILLDLRLPKVDGLQVLKKIKITEKLRHIPVVILSTSADDRDIAQAYDYHANHYLVKPIDHNDLTQLLKELDVGGLGLSRQ